MSVMVEDPVAGRVKFPRTRREQFLMDVERRQKEVDAAGENPKAGMTRYASCASDALQPYPMPSAAPSVVTQASTSPPSRLNKNGTMNSESESPQSAQGSLRASKPGTGNTTDGSPLRLNTDRRSDISMTSIESPPLLSISQVGLNGYNYGPVTPWSERSFRLPSENDEVFPESPQWDASKSRLYFNSVNQYLPYDTRLQPIRETDEYLLRESEFNEQASDFDILCYSLGIIFFLVNIGSDVALAIKYLTAEEYVYFGLTASFVLLPAICMTTFSVILYRQDRRVLQKKSSSTVWCSRVLCHIFLLAPLIRLIETLRYGLKSRRDEGWRLNRENYKHMLDDDVDLTLIRLFENFLENAPQLTLQLYIMSTYGIEKDYILLSLQIIGVMTSWVSLAWSFVSFATALRHTLPGKARMRTTSKTALFIWRFFTIGARVIALALFASAFGFWSTLALIGGHLIVMLIWMLQQNSHYCRIQQRNEDGKLSVYHSTWLEYLFRAMVAFIHIFAFFNVAEGRTRLRSFAFYGLVHIENVTMIASWYISASTIADSWYQTPAIVMVNAGFLIGILFQILYYKCWHPNSYSKEHQHLTIPLCIPCDQLSMLGPNLKIEKEVPEEGKPLSMPVNTPIYNPPVHAPAKPGSVSGNASLAGVYRPTDDSIDLNESLTYRPQSIHRSTPGSQATPLYIGSKQSMPRSDGRQAPSQAPSSYSGSPSQASRVTPSNGAPQPSTEFSSPAAYSPDKVLLQQERSKTPETTV